MKFDLGNKGKSSLPDLVEVEVDGYQAAEQKAGSETPSVDRKEPAAEPEGRHTKDPKSITQNLFDTFSLRLVEWLPLRPAQKGIADEAIPRRSSHTSNDAGRPIDQGASTGKAQETGKPAVSKEAWAERPVKSSTGATVLLPYTLPSVPAESTIQSPSAKQTVFEATTPRHRKLSADDSHYSHAKPDKKPRHVASTPSNAVKSSTDISSPPALRHRPQKNPRLQSDARAPGHRRSVSWRKEPTTPSAKGTCSNDASDQKLGLEKTFNSEENLPEKDRCSKVENVALTVSYLSPDIVDGLTEMLAQSGIKDRFSTRDIDCVEFMLRPSRQYDLKQHWALMLKDQSLYYVLSTPAALLKSFRPLTNDGTSTESRTDVQAIFDTFVSLYGLHPFRDLAHALWLGLEPLFTPPDHLNTAIRSGKKQSSQVLVPRKEYINDDDAAHIILVSLAALFKAIPPTVKAAWQTFSQTKSEGGVYSEVQSSQLDHSQSQVRWLVAATDLMEDDVALRLVGRLVRAINARLIFWEMSKARSDKRARMAVGKARNVQVFDLVIQEIRKHFQESPKPVSEDPFEDHRTGLHFATALVEWFRTIFLKEWDSNPEIQRSSVVGGAVQILALLYKERDSIGLAPENFYTSFIPNRLDPMHMPARWLQFPQNNQSLHILSYSFLFPPAALVIYFRSLNYDAMAKSYESSQVQARLMNIMTFSSILHPRYDRDVVDHLRPTTNAYFVLTVRRDNVLTDALDQLWRRERRELMRPLRVQMGIEEGEQGIDFGGVQQEFFRVAIAEALSPEFGMFSVDDKSRMSWFEPASLEPLYKYELIGMLFSIAVYNGVTLPVTFPVALYRKLLSLKVKKTDHIRTGWPELAKGLDSLLSWRDGDVGDVFMRTYEFSMESYGRVITVDMRAIKKDTEWSMHDPDPSKKSPSLSGDNIPSSSSSAPEPELVTNANRERFVKDYIFWLTDKSIRPQYEAFARGFYTCLDRTALSIFTPETLKLVVEGIQEIDIAGLERVAKYDGGFHRDHALIKSFWEIVGGFDLAQRKKLLEFVTASDRVPVNGIESVSFTIQKNGSDDLVCSFLFYYVVFRLTAKHAILIT